MPASSTGNAPSSSANLPGSANGQVTPLYGPMAAQYQTQIGNTTPPTQQTLVYAPDVRIIIRHNGLQYEVSNDLVRGTVIRRENAASTLLWTCHNKGLRYTNGVANQPLFYRMDAVTCYMKRSGTWVQVFTGYLDSVPYLDLYPGLVNFKATCTLKRLLCTWWNPGLPDSAAIMNQLSASQDVSGDGKATKYNDSGLGNLLRDLLEKVGGWNPLNIHIENFPNGFLDLLANQLQDQAANTAQADKFRQLLEGDVTTGPPGAMASYNTSAGMPGPYGAGVPGGPGAGSNFYVQEIIAATDALGMGPNTQDIKLSSGLTQAATAGEGSRDQATQEAFQQTQAAAKAYNTSTRNSDAAILAVACAMQESNVLVLANYNDPDSLNYQHDGVGHDGTSVGLFQQTNEGWGSVSQRMNPRQSATMFLQALNRQDWRNEDPGVAVYAVQRALDQAGYTAAIDAKIPEATKLVQAARGAASGASSTVSTALSSPLGQLASVGAGTVGGTDGTATATAISNGIITDVSTGQRPGKPSPDSEGAINWIATKIGCAYVYGADGSDGKTYDCSSLLMNAFRAIGLNIGRDTYSQARNGQRISPANIKRGDSVQPNDGHTTLWLADGTILEAGNESTGVHRTTAYYNPATAYGIFRFCDNGGPDPTSPFNSPLTSGPGLPPGTGAGTSGGGTGVGGSAAGGGEPIAQNLFAYLFTPDAFLPDLSLMYGAANPQKDFIDCQPLIQMVQSVCGAGIRNFASAPNGDFIAYYPDYFGMDGSPAVFILEDIELKNFSMNFSDDALTTHVYVNGAYTPLGETDQEMGWLRTLGYATVENTLLFQRMRAVAPGDLENLDGEALMKRFGVRPLQVTYGNIWAGELEFLLSVRIFMEKWAAQYQNAVSFTFLPDLFPGMRVNMAKHNVQVYVTEVTHNFDFEHGFDTEAVVCAPSNPMVRNLWATTGSANSTVPPTIPSVTPSGGTTPSITTVIPVPGLTPQ